MRTTRLSLLTAVAVAVLPGAVAPSGAGAAERCSARGAKVAQENTQARLFSVRGSGKVKRSWYGCTRGSKPILLTRDVDPRSDEETHISNTMFRLAGPAVAWVQTGSSDFGAGEFGRSIEGRVLRRGGPRFSVEATDNGDPDALAVRADGAAAFTFAQRDGYREVDAIAPGGRATALAFGREIDPASLAIDDAGVRWTQAGAPRTAPVPAGDQPAPPSPTATPGPELFDPRFGSCGVVEPPSLPEREGATARSVARAPDGSVVVAGHGSYGRYANNILLSRVRPDGTVDASFGQQGAVVAPVPRPDGAQRIEVTAVAVQPDGKILVSAVVVLENPVKTRSALARFNPDGSLDTGFGDGGFVRDALPARHNGHIHDIALTGDGRIVAAATRNDGSGDFPEPVDNRFAVSRYSAAGALDPSFGSGGVTEVEPSLGHGSARAIRVAGDKLVVAGEAGRQFALVRLNGDGTLDTAFAGNGRALASPPGSGSLTSLAVLPDGRIAAVGAVDNVSGFRQLTLARYDASGRPDPGFGAGGFAIDYFASNPGGLAVQDDGRLLVTGASGYGTTSSGTGLLRYNADGSRDRSFGVSGALLSFGGSSMLDNSIVQQPDGTVVTPSAVSTDVGVARFVVAEPALQAVAGAPRACGGRVATKSRAQLIKRGTRAKYGKLRVAFDRHQGGKVRLTATARVGSRTVTLGATTHDSPVAGTSIADIKTSSTAYRTLARARSAQITVTLIGTEGGAAVTTEKTLR